MNILLKIRFVKNEIYRMFFDSFRTKKFFDEQNLFFLC